MEWQAGERVVRVPVGETTLDGNLTLPASPIGVVLFAHGSGSSRHSPRNRYVARVLNEGGLATLLVDLLTSEEEAVDRRTGHLRFNIELLAKRLLGAAEWLKTRPQTRQRAIGYFGASTGAAAALVAAAERPELVGAVVSRGGRPDRERFRAGPGPSVSNGLKSGSGSRTDQFASGHLATRRGRTGVKRPRRRNARITRPRLCWMMTGARPIDRAAATSIA
jgi:dienelactone hydrolase